MVRCECCGKQVEGGKSAPGVVAGVRPHGNLGMVCYHCKSMLVEIDIVGIDKVVKFMKKEKDPWE